jgi:hypothetical protein
MQTRTLDGGRWLRAVDDETRMDHTVTTGIDGRWGECSWTARDLVSETTLASLEPDRISSEPAPPARVEELPSDAKRELPIFRWLLASGRTPAPVHG